MKEKQQIPGKGYFSINLIDKIPISMRLLIFFLFISFVSVSASTSAQRITLNMKNVKMEQIVSAIAKQANLSAAYSKQAVNLDRKIDVDVTNMDLRAVLDKVVQGTGIGYEVKNDKIYLFPETEKVKVVQQNQIIKGVVKDAIGEPLIGVAVVVKGTANGTITDLNGNFSIAAAKGTMLEFSYVGYQKQELKAQEWMEVLLKEDMLALDEVVVVGFGSQKKVNLTGAVGMVNADELTSRPVVNATQALQGLIPGLQISQSSGSLESSPSMNIRGVGTIGDGSTGSPLVLIDGMEGDINTINPQDIENISVLKDAAASSIYGSRAPFGVVLITTKMGKEGKTVINYNNNFRVGSPITIPKQMDSYTFATYYNDGYANANWGYFFSEDHLKRIKDYQEGRIDTEIIVNPSNKQYWADGYMDGNANNDWYDIIYKDQNFSQEHNFSINGGSSKINYYLSANYLGQEGLMKLAEDSYDRYSTTAKMNIQAFDWAHLNFSMRFTREDYTRPSTMTNNLYKDLARQGWPTLPLYDPNGYLYSSPSPALGLATGGMSNKQTDNLNQQVSLILEPLKNWVTRVDFNYGIKQATNHWDLQKTYNHDVAGNPVVSTNESNVHEDQLKENYLNLNVVSDYSFSIKERHNFKVMLGFQAEELNQKVFGAQRDGVIIPGLPVMDLTTGTSSDGKDIIPQVNGALNSWSTAGFFGRLNYDYQGRYLLEVNGRYDGTSRFQQEKRWNVFPSVSLGWNIARESFWQSLESVVNTLKLRASYGELGNQNTKLWYPTYRILKVHSKEGEWLQNGAKPNTAYTPALISSMLGWERINNWNIGLDWGVFNNRLKGSFDYYVRNTLDMVGPAPELPAILGTDVPKTNNTDLQTYGWELELSWNDRLQNGLDYSIKLLLSDSQTEITRYPNDTKTFDRYYSGQKMGDVWGYETIGIAKSDQEMADYLATLPNGGQNSLGNNWLAGDVMYKDLNGDGKIDKGANTLSDHGDLKLIGNNTPRYLFGIDLSAAWKGIDFRAFFQGVAKRDYWQGSSYFWGATTEVWHSTGFVEHTDYFRAEASNDLPANLDAYYPRPVFATSKNQQTQTRYLQDASYIRLKNLQFGYTLPASLTQKASISKLRIFISGENLWTGTKLANMFDPETISGGDGQNGNAYPLSKTISFGLSVTL